MDSETSFEAYWASLPSVHDIRMLYASAQVPAQAVASKVPVATGGDTRTPSASPLRIHDAHATDPVYDYEERADGGDDEVADYSDTEAAADDSRSASTMLADANDSHSDGGETSATLLASDHDGPPMPGQAQPQLVWRLRVNTLAWGPPMCLVPERLFGDDAMDTSADLDSSDDDAMEGLSSDGDGSMAFCSNPQADPYTDDAVWRGENEGSTGSYGDTEAGVDSFYSGRDGDAESGYSEADAVMEYSPLASPASLTTTNMGSPTPAAPTNEDSITAAAPAVAAGLNTPSAAASSVRNSLRRGGLTVTFAIQDAAAFQRYASPVAHAFSGDNANHLRAPPAESGRALAVLAAVAAEQDYVATPAVLQPVAEDAGATMPLDGLSDACVAVDETSDELESDTF